MCAQAPVCVCACVLASTKGGRGVGFMLQHNSSKSYKNYGMGAIIMYVAILRILLVIEDTLKEVPTHPHHCALSYRYKNSV